MRALAWLVGWSVVACGGGGGDGAVTDNEGVFAVDAWTLDEGCDGGEVDISANNPVLVGVGNQVVFGSAVVSAVACADSGECSARLEPDYVGLLDATFTFISGDDDAGYDGSRATALSTVDGCEGQWADHRLIFDGATLRIESDRTASLPMESDGDGFCTTSEAEAVARGTPCAEREVITATRQ